MGRSAILTIGKIDADHAQVFCRDGISTPARCTTEKYG